MSASGAQILLTVVLLGVAGGAAAQDVGDRPEGVLGFEARTLKFDRLVGVQRVWQTVVPVGFVVPVGRFTLDVGSSWASTHLERGDGTSHAVDAFTDTQVRGSYVFGQDAVVATVLVNLPTGLDEASVKDFTVVGAVSPSLFAFPVVSYAGGFSVTSGLAVSIPAGDWSVGFAGSVRVGSRFTPYTDVVGPITYKPGVEGRVRGAVDGLIGASRLSLGFTYSTFGNDQFGKTPALTSRGEYRPGPRWLGEAVLTAPIGSSTLNLSFWNFRRTAGDTTGVSARNRENLAAGDLAISIPLGRSVTLEPELSARSSKPEVGKGRMAGLGTGLRIRVSNAVSFAPSARYDTGWIEDDSGKRNDFSGGYFSGFVRISF